MTTECVGRAMLKIAKRGAPKAVLDNQDINSIATTDRDLALATLSSFVHLIEGQQTPLNHLGEAFASQLDPSLAQRLSIRVALCAVIVVYH
jgi:hypothetical protein